MSFYNKVWWKEAIGYQIYIKSFKDSNNDGIGDLGGVIEKLDYLKELGITLIWLTPFYPSPMDDNGYDISNHTDVDSSFGSIEDFKKLVKEAKKRNIKIIIDLVLNHTSDEHRWFIESRKSKDNKYRNYYIWEDGKIKNNEMIEPTNLASFFGGSCWNYDNKTNQYYMKIFSNKMPDLNWSNKDVRNEMYEVAKFWLNLGVDGFRIDAVSHIGRSKKLKNSKLKSDEKYVKDWSKFSNLKPTYKYLKEFSQKVLNKNNLLTIGEVGGGATVKEALKYSHINKGPLTMVFNFDHTFCNNTFSINDFNTPIKVDLLKLKEVFNNWQTKPFNKTWQPFYWLNHDHPRLINQYGDINNHYLSSTMLASALYFKWGTPFIYQGEEIGMTNYNFTKISDFADISTITSYYIEKQNPDFNEKLFIYLNGLKTRDNSRTVMCWNSKKYAGFSTVKPWFHLNQNYKDINVENDRKKDKSIFNYYKKIIELRKNKEYKNTLVYGTYKQLFKDHKDLYVYIRKADKTILTIVNFSNNNVKIDISNYEIIEALLSNYDNDYINLNNLSLKKYEAISFLVKETNYTKSSIKSK